MSWKSIVSKLQEITAIISLVANTILILLVLTKSPKQIGSYKYLMIYISIFEMSYSFIDVIIEPIMISQGSIYLCLVNINKSAFSYQTNVILLSVWAAFFGSFMGLFVLQFLYRYCVASGFETSF
ncbi:unnamed protein product [Caenorhabditis angaria]|uniref:G-protein coupled receptors family 1 profile domain-containing protein n=1 Tax=Caenorhabditis angaria TaxID=860376 RepID=A0A9P1IYL9_9PELO|nr:unnamed protein product [Caenorhabditis angaria]